MAASDYSEFPAKRGLAGRAMKPQPTGKRASSGPSPAQKPTGYPAGGGKTQGRSRSLGVKGGRFHVDSSGI